MTSILNHLLQSTLFAAALALLSLAFRKNHARTRYMLWLAASVKFLIPFSLLIGLGQQLSPNSERLPAGRTLVVIEQVSSSFTPLTAAAATADYLPLATFTVWCIGFTSLLIFWFRRYQRVRSAHRTARPLDLATPIPVLSTATLLEPGVVGIRRPVLIMPEGIVDRLTPEQLDAIVAHELCHVRRRDNFTAAIHMVVEAIFWFHPLVWWLGARLVEERERACDEEVVRQGNPPSVYAEGILTVCKFYLESPLVCVSGVTGSNLRRRIESIMTQRGSSALSLPRKLLLAAAAISAIAGPIASGMMNPPIAPPVRAPRKASISVQSNGRFIASGTTARMLIQKAYQLKDFQISGGPEWIDNEPLEIDTPASAAIDGPGHMQAMLQQVLSDQFHLEFRRETQVLPVYSLVVGSHGSSLAASPVGDKQQIRVTPGRIEGHRMTIGMLANQLSAQLGRVVIDRTDLAGAYDGTLSYTPGGLFTALEQQFGLRLEATQAPVDRIIIMKIDKPSK